MKAFSAPLPQTGILPNPLVSCAHPHLFLNPHPPFLHSKDKFRTSIHSVFFFLQNSKTKQSPPKKSLPPLVCFVYLGVDWSCTLFKARVVGSGQTAIESNIKITLFVFFSFLLFFSPPTSFLPPYFSSTEFKKSCSDREKQSALRTKLITVGERQKVDE